MEHPEGPLDNPGDPEAPEATTQSFLGLPQRFALGAIAVGVAYGLLARLLFGFLSSSDATGVMLVSFVFIVPVALGFVSVYLQPGPNTGARWALAPLAASLLTVASAMLLAWEGLICIVVWLPIFLVLAVVGGGAAALARRYQGRRSSLILWVVVVLPFVIAPIEIPFPAQELTRVVTDTIVIDAPAETVWREIREVRPISADELGSRFVHTIGFPRPIEARLEGTGVGSVRHATFEGGVTFVETVTEWVPNESLAFTISADAVPSTTFDTHVAVGGPFFDVLDGRYRIDELETGGVALHLDSTQRLSTRFNGYTALWTDFFMSDIQSAILDVIKARSEAVPPAPSGRTAARGAGVPLAGE